MSTIIPQAGNATIILSAELDWRDDCRNGLDHIELRARLARQLEIGELLTVAECAGMYKCTPERSIAITGKASTVRAIAQREAERFSQESVLYVSPAGDGILHFTSGAPAEPIGRYQPIGGRLDDIDDIEAWTRVLATGETFTFS